MALDVDGLAVLRAIAQAPEAFPDVRAELAKSARALVVKQLKVKGLSLEGLRRVRDSLGAETFALVVDGLTDADAKGIVGRLDKLHPDLKTAPPDWPRRHLVALSDGADLAVRAIKPKAASPLKPGAQSTGVTRALGSPAFAASWDGKDHDADAEPVPEAPAKSTSGKATSGKATSGKSASAKPASAKPLSAKPSSTKPSSTKPSSTKSTGARK